MIKPIDLVVAITKSTHDELLLSDILQAPYTPCQPMEALADIAHIASISPNSRLGRNLLACVMDKAIA